MQLKVTVILETDETPDDLEEVADLVEDLLWDLDDYNTKRVTVTEKV